jgi:hypothetical protein
MMARLQVSANESLKAISSCRVTAVEIIFETKKKTNKEIPRLLLWERPAAKPQAFSQEIEN